MGINFWGFKNFFFLFEKVNWTKIFISLHPIKFFVICQKKNWAWTGLIHVFLIERFKWLFPSHPPSPNLIYFRIWSNIFRISFPSLSLLCDYRIGMKCLLVFCKSNLVPIIAGCSIDAPIRVLAMDVMMPSKFLGAFVLLAVTIDSTIDVINTSVAGLQVSTSGQSKNNKICQPVYSMQLGLFISCPK